MKKNILALFGSLAFAAAIALPNCPLAGSYAGSFNYPAGTTTRGPIHAVGGKLLLTADAGGSTIHCYDTALMQGPQWSASIGLEDSVTDGEPERLLIPEVLFSAPAATGYALSSAPNKLFSIDLASGLTNSTTIASAPLNGYWCQLGIQPRVVVVSEKAVEVFDAISLTRINLIPLAVGELLSANMDDSTDTVFITSTDPPELTRFAFSGGGQFYLSGVRDTPAQPTDCIVGPMTFPRDVDHLRSMKLA